MVSQRITDLKDIKPLRLFSLIAAVVGLLNSLYLTWIKLSHNESICLQGLGDCATVNTSRYAEVFGIPIAIFGAGAYLAILVVLLFEDKIDFLKDNGTLVLFGISLAGVLYSAYLTYLEIAVIRAICPFCVISAIMMLSIFGLTVTRLVRTQVEP